MAAWDIFLIGLLGIYDLWAIIIITAVSDRLERVQHWSLLLQVPFWICQPLFFLFPAVWGFDVLIHGTGGLAVGITLGHLWVLPYHWRPWLSFGGVFGGVLLLELSMALIAFPAGVSPFFWWNSAMDIGIVSVGGIIGAVLVGFMRSEPQETLAFVT
jgi:hypothetical protein